MSRWTCPAWDELTEETFATCARCRSPRPVGGGWPAAPTLILRRERRA